MTAETIISLIIGSLISIGASSYFSFRFSQEKDISYVYSTSTVVDRVDPVFKNDITISYKGTPIGELIAIHFALWNSGGREIVKTDIRGEGELRVWIPDLKILDVTPITTNRDAINPLISAVQDESVGVTFDFLNKNDTICFTIYADASSDEEHRIEAPLLEGDIIGHNRPFSDLTDILTFSSAASTWGMAGRLSYILAIACVVAAVNMLVLSIFSPIAFHSIIRGEWLREEGKIASIIFLSAVFLQILYFGLATFFLLRAQKVSKLASQHCTMNKELSIGQLNAR